MPLISSQLSAAIAAMRALLPLEYPADAIIRRFFRDNAILGVQDRAFIAEVVFGVLRHRFFLEHLANPITPRALVLAYLVKFHGLNLREFDTLASESEKKWLAEIKAIKIDSFPLAVQAEFPDWLVEKLQNTLSDEQILELGLALQKPAPLDLRVNTFLSKREEVMDALQQEGIEAQVTPYSPCGIRLVGKPMINRHALFLSGKIEVQDEGSQLLGYLLAPRFKRSGLSNLHVQRINDENDSKVKRLSGKIDRVLVDAPCSGIGTLRRNPDLKWRQSPQSIEELKIKQRDILASAARLLKPGGRLVYATCSFLREENQDIINSFLEKNPQFTVLNATELLSQQKIALDTGEFLQINPQQHQTDGFFAAALQRNT